MADTGRLVRNMLAILIGVLPLQVGMISYRLTQEPVFTVSEMLVYPLIFGSANILLILLLNRCLLREPLSGFNPGKARWYTDLLYSLALFIIWYGLLFIERPLLSRILPPGNPPSPELFTLLKDLAGNPFLLAVWLGPVVWIGVALFEELIRVFFMKCLWRMSDRKVWQTGAVVLVALLTGVLHLYQGAFGIISVSIQGLIAGFFYYRFRRFWPLVIAHALYDSIQVFLLLVQLNRG